MRLNKAQDVERFCDTLPTINAEILYPKILNGVNDLEFDGYKIKIMKMGIGYTHEELFGSYDVAMFFALAMYLEH